MNQRKKESAFNYEFNSPGQECINPTDEIQSFYFSKKNNVKSATNLSELRYYLEEMYQIDLLNPIEMEIYERYQFEDTITYEEWLYIKSNLHTYYKLKF